MTSETPAAAKPPVDKRIAALRRFAVSITVFSIIGRAFLGFEQTWLQWFVALGTAYTLEIGLETLDARMKGRPAAYRGGRRNLINFLLPAHIAGTAISMLIYPGARLFPFVFAVSVAICAKHVVKAPVNGRWRHVFNPSNLGIAVTLASFTWVGPAPPYQFIETTHGLLDWIIPLALLASGLMLNIQLTGKWPLIAGWLGGFALQALLRAPLVGDIPLAALAVLTGPAFLLFTNYMITDPGTTPVRPRNQVVFGMTTAAIYGTMAATGVVFALFYSLVVACALRGAVLYGVALRARRRARVEAVPAAAAPTTPVEPKLVPEGV